CLNKIHPPSIQGTSQVKQAHRASLNSSADCGPLALQAVCQKLGIKSDLRSLRATAGTNESGTTLEGLAKAARSLGLRAEGLQVDATALHELHNPAVLWFDGNHFIAILNI